MNRFNLRLLLTALIIGFSTTSYATLRWVDVTAQYFNNPGFTSADKSEWIIAGSAQSLGAISFKCIEMWSGTMRLEKTLTGVPNGHYQLTLNGLYRTRDHATAYQNHVNGTENIRGFMFVNNTEKALASEYSFHWDHNTGTNYTPDNLIYFPNSMETAGIAFTAGEYVNTIEFDVTDGKIDLGVYNDESIYDNWMIFSNFKLEYFEDLNDATAESMIINEIMPANVDMYWSDATNFDGWIELYNPTSQNVTLAGYYISDDHTDLKKWKVPATFGVITAHGYKTVWFDHNNVNHNHAQFKLDCDGGSVFISDANGNLLVSQAYPAALSRTAYARTTDGGNTWGYTSTPTPAATNSTATFATVRLNAPTVSPDGQLFTGSLNISVNIPEGSTLRYTTNGTTPTFTNGTTSTSGQFTITANTNYRFRVFKDGYLPSTVVTRSYIIKEHDITLPVISVTTPNAYLYDDYYGIFVKGTNGITGNGQSTGANWNQDWDRPANFEYILPDNTMVLNQDVNMSVSGGWTRSNALKAFKLKAGKVYDGLNSLNYSFFDAKPYIKNKTLQVRAGGNDGTRIKDAALQTIMQRSGIDIDLQSYQPTIHYINGIYKGVINVREPNNKDFAYANFGYDDDEIEMFEQSPDSGRYMMIGTTATLERIEQLAETASQADSYAELKRLIDIDEYINYMAAQLYLGSTDWPDNNLKVYRKLDGGHYRITLFDLDFAFGVDGCMNDENGKIINGSPFGWLEGMQWHWYDYIYDEGARRYGEIKFVTVFLNMLKNDEFRKKFIDTYSIMGGSVFDPTRATDYMTELGNRVTEALSYEGISPTGTLSNISSNLTGRADKMATFAKAYSPLKLTDVTKQSAKLDADTKGARLYINNIEIPYTTFDGKLFAPVTLKAQAPAGYKFAGWKRATDTSKNLIDNGTNWIYYDQGSLGGTTWNTAAYNDGIWQEKAAPLGYGNIQTVTTLDYGTDANNKRSTYYFRKSVTLDDTPTTASTFTLNYTVDDGFIVYVNGTEAGRHNLTGIVTYATLASTANSNPDTGSLTLAPSLFKKGDNLIAVEVHNNTLNSSDILWDAQLQCEISTMPTGYYSTNAEVTIPTADTFHLTACFEPLSNQEKTDAGYTPVKINEVSAANSIYINEYFKKADWVELYNTTDKDIDIEGMYLSNDRTLPQKYQITKGASKASTTLPAHGYITIWCDKLAPASVLHAAFKLAAEGGTMLLTAKNKSWVDSLVYAAHNGDETVGRYPDGNSKVYVMNIPTIGKQNIYSSYVTEVSQTTTSGISNPYIASNNGLKVHYAAYRLIVRDENAGDAKVNIYTLSGQDAMSRSISLTNGYKEIDLSTFAAGCYIAKVIDSEGNTASCKFIIAQ